MCMYMCMCMCTRMCTCICRSEGFPLTRIHFKSCACWLFRGRQTSSRLSSSSSSFFLSSGPGGARRGPAGGAHTRAWGPGWAGRGPHRGGPAAFRGPVAAGPSGGAGRLGAPARGPPASWGPVEAWRTWNVENKKSPPAAGFFIECSVRLFPLTRRGGPAASGPLVAPVLAAQKCVCSN